MGSWLRPCWMRKWLLLCGCLWACTPIQASGASSSTGPQGSNQEAAGASSVDVAPSDSSGPDGGASSRGVTQADRACDQEGMRACGPGRPSRQPLVCESLVWRAQVPCDEGQRCGTLASAEVGTCVPIARECIGRTTGEEFCDDAVVRACADGISAVVRTCDAQQRCLQLAGQSSCECATGSVPMGNVCIAATNCDTERGGCDMLADCTMTGAGPSCGSCPPGFTGTGQTGCSPQLIALEIVGGELMPSLMPPLSDGIRTYRLPLSFVQPQVQLKPSIPSKTLIEINGKELPRGETWTSPVLTLGEHTAAIVLNATNGQSTRYELTLARTGAQEAFIKARSPDADDYFGYGVAISGDTLVVGAPREDGAVGGINGDDTGNGAADSGAVYVFVRQGVTWTQQAYLKAEHPSAAEFFGTSVAIDGDTLLVGAPRGWPYPQNGDSIPARIGAAYVFVRQAGVWTQKAQISPAQGAAGDLFGYSVWLTKDTFAIGAPYDAAAVGGGGAAYVAPRSDSWGPLTKLAPAQPVTSGGFGWVLALESDTLLVGAPEPGTSTTRGQGPGSAYVFLRKNAVWTEDQTLQAKQPENGASFGWSVALEGDTAAIGAPRAADAAITPSPPGEAYLFGRTNERWGQTAVLQAAYPRNSDFYGSSVLVSGSLLLVGASGDMSAAAGLDGDANRSDAFLSGAFVLYGQQDGAWRSSTYAKAAHPTRGAQLAQVAAISHDTIVIGAMLESTASGGVNVAPKGSSARSGAVYVFR
jgi:hypothetical protein